MKKTTYIYSDYSDAENARNYIFRSGGNVIGTNTLINIDDWLKRTREIK